MTLIQNHTRGISRGKAGLCFVRINGHLYNPGRPRILAGLALGSDEQRHHVCHRIQDGTIRIHPGKLVLHRTGCQQFAGLAKSRTGFLEARS